MIDRIFLQEFDRLSLCKSIEDSSDLMDIYQECMFSLLTGFHGKPVDSIFDRDANIVFQMMFTKLLYLEEIISGVSYSGNSKKLNELIDPTIVAISIRNIFETACIFHLIYVNTSNEEEKMILYNLWAHAGLKYRSRFGKIASTEENIAKIEDEKKEMGRLKQEMVQSELFQSLKEKGQGKILTKLKEKDYKISIEDKKVNFLSWQQITQLMGLNEELFDDIYTYFSLYTHPSNVSVFQFSDLFEKGEEGFKSMSNFNLQNAFVFLSIFISDYINYFPQTLSIYEEMPLLNQVLIDFKNITMRGEEYSINNSFKVLEKVPKKYL
jgi:hypothetical protein